MVSSRMPKATARPSSVRNVAGIVARTANVPASTNPAEVITPPVAASPDDGAVAGVAFVGFFADPGHQEDVVVNAERDEEHVHQQRACAVNSATTEEITGSSHSTGLR